MQRSSASSSKNKAREGRPLLAYYGDDFTGATDVMEALVRVGLRTALFLTPPGRAQLKRFPGLRAFGVAGAARTFTPAEMSRELPPVFRRLRASGAAVVHYKICSTFDSSPRVGNIGHAIDLGQRLFHSRLVPLMVGAPVLGRYCVFGNLFARSGLETEPQRLDRHPTMRHHPITPMDESDLRLHLARQTPRPVHLFDLLKLAAPIPALPKAWRNGDIVLFDVLEDRHLAVVGRLIWSGSGPRPLFVAGSSGIEYALCAHWRETGQLPPRPSAPRPIAVKQIVAVSGSCSPVTELQIRHALARGFAGIALDAAGLLDSRHAQKQKASAAREAVEWIDRGRSVILHTCLGPEDQRLGRWANRRAFDGRMLGHELGTLLLGILRERPLARAAVTGGDTSSYVARALGVEVLEVVAPIAPGSPLCRVAASNPQVDGLEIVFKGGQVGRADFFDTLLRGGDPSVWQ